MEVSGMLDPCNEIDMYALHYVFLPRINKNLEEFSAAHSMAPISTEKNKSPVQLWIQGLTNVCNSEYSVAEELSIVSNFSAFISEKQDTN